MINIYVVDVWRLSAIAGCGMFVWFVFAQLAEKNKRGRISFVIISILMTVLAIYGIFAYTILHRNTGETHQFVLFSYHKGEFFRELFMNGLLYLPLGMALSVFLGPWVILVAFFLSVGIETWQYFTGTGLAQGTDVIMNTLGAAIGVIPLWVNKKVKGCAHRK